MSANRFLSLYSHSNWLCLHENPHEEFYRKSFIEVFDQVVFSLTSRFDNDSAAFFKSLESFAIGQSDNVEKIVEFCRDDFVESNLKSGIALLLALMQ